MKKNFKFMIMLMLVAVCIAAFVGCDKNKEYPDVELEEPNGFYTEFYTLKWEAVDMAELYTIEINGNEYETAVPEIDLTYIVSPGTRCLVQVTAICNKESFKNSPAVQEPFAAPEPTPNIEYVKDESAGVAFVSRKEGELYEGEYIITLDEYEGLPVVYLAGFGELKINFQPATKIVGVRVPLHADMIYSASFLNCKKLKSVTIPPNVKLIGSLSFEGTGIEEISLPENLEEIDVNAFANSSLKNIEFNKNLKKIGIDAFEGTPWYNAQPDGYIKINGILYRHKGDFDAGAVVTDLPDAETLGEKLFQDCKGLQKFVCPYSITTLPNGMFQGCTDLEEVYLHDGITSIGRMAFKDCSKLTTVNIPRGITVLENNLFSGCSSLKEIALPDKLEKIDSYAFTDCASLKEIVIPDKVESIGQKAFYGCVLFEEIDLPEGLKEIGPSAFSGCSLLKKVKLPDGLESLGSLAFSNCVSLKEIRLPASLKYRNINTFEGCTGLETVIINKPANDNVQFRYMFEGCDSLKEIYYTGEDVAELSRFSAYEGKPQTIYFYSQAQPSIEGNFWHYAEDGVTPIKW